MKILSPRPGESFTAANFKKPSRQRVFCLKSVQPVIRHLNFTILILLIWLLATTAATEAQTGDSLQRVLILLDPTLPGQASLRQLRADLTAAGGQVIHLYPPGGLIAQLPPPALATLARRLDLAAVLTGPLPAGEFDQVPVAAHPLIYAWNNLIQPIESGQGMALTPKKRGYSRAFWPPDFPPAGAPPSGSSLTPGYYQTSEFMAGSVAVGIILVESDGTVDPSTEDWTQDEQQEVFSEIASALNWWAELNPAAGLSFVYDDHFTHPLPTGVEPINRPYHDQQLWISDALDDLGYNSDSYFSGVRDYLNNLRYQYQTDWAFAIFVVDSSNDSDNYFSNGYFAYAYLGGPFLVMTSGNNGYGLPNMDTVAAHEIGHIFYALDQYYSARQLCSYSSGYLDVTNENSQYGNCASNVTSIMRGQISPYAAKAIDSYAAGQIGWRDGDGDGIIDPLDTPLTVMLETLTVDHGRVMGRGSVMLSPFPSPTHSSVTINRLVSIQVRADGGAWQPARAVDGTIDHLLEDFEFTLDLSPGRHTLEVTAADSAGNTPALPHQEHVSILDPIDGSLNTELYPLTSEQIRQSSAPHGIAYDLDGRTVTRVEYRVNNGPWQSANPLDEAFDSADESFILDLVLLNAGAYLIEARATDDQGNIEVNPAVQQINIGSHEPALVYLPLLVK